MSVVARLVETIKRWDLFDGHDTLLVAVSGGMDSVVLLHLLLHLPKKLRPIIHVAHFNHRLRGRASDQDARFVEKLCRQWGVVYHGGRASPWRHHSNIEARAREIRYQFLRETAGRQRIRKILTAHQADDQAETFLIRWVQGAGLKGLAGIPLVRQEGQALLIRPLLFIPRQDIEDYVRQYRLPFQKDATNQDLRFLRNQVRKLLKKLKKFNPRLPAMTALNSVFLKEDQEFIESHVKKLFKTRIPRSTYRHLMPALRYRLLQKFVPLKSDIVLKLDELAMRAPSGHQFDLAGGMSFHIHKDSIEVLRGRISKKRR